MEQVARRSYPSIRLGQPLADGRDGRSHQDADRARETLMARLCRVTIQGPTFGLDELVKRGKAHVRRLFNANEAFE